MFRQSSEVEYEEMAQGGTRYLFRMDHYHFSDTLDGDGYLHYFVSEESGDEAAVYETDHDTMYEFMARYLAGVYEKTHYEMVRSPTHAALMDLLELATARARSGDPAFSFDVVEEMDDIEDDGPADEQAG